MNDQKPIFFTEKLPYYSNLKQRHFLTKKPANPIMLIHTLNFAFSVTRIHCKSLFDKTAKERIAAHKTSKNCSCNSARHVTMIL